ncbi:MAG: helicase-related protein, partial [Ktedonobacteraceae bacterium]
LEAHPARKLVQSCQLLVIEEAHQDLRNVDNKFHRNIREVALDTYGLLVTATPWNNRRGDIFAMLQPFASNRKGIDRPAHLFACFSKGLAAGQEEFEQNTSLFQHIYSSTTLQRTRRQLRESGDTSVFYAPRRPYLISVPYTPDQQQHFTTLLEKIEQLHLPAYNPIRHLTTADSSENRLSGIHRFQLLKRAESSMYAFASSLQKLADQAQSLSQNLSTVADRESAIATWLYTWYQREEIASQHAQLLDEPKILPRKPSRTHKLIENAAQEGRLRTLRMQLLEDCQHDRQLIHTIQQDFADLFAKDPKIEMVLHTIQNNIAQGRKVLCISQSADTAYAVYRAVMADPLLIQKGIGFLTSSSKGTYAPAQINDLAANRNEILSRFAPRSWSSPAIKHKTKHTEQRYPANIDILIGSDTLSVGQNLQDARVLLNLDLCWNPMQHEQRIGRLDRPRHKDDSEPLDIYYFLNLDLIEAELALRKTLEERLASTYQDTAFDDEIFPGYFDMIEQFSRLRKEQKYDVSYVAEADALLEEIAERSARPAADIAADNERESVALQRLQEQARSFAPAEESKLNRQLVNIGRIPYYDDYDWQPSLSATRPDAALVAEVRFQTLDQQRRSIGKAIYQHVYMSIYVEEGLQAVHPKITLNDAALFPVVMGFLAEPSRIPLRREHITHLQAMLIQLEAYVQQTLENQRSLFKRQQRYLHNQDNTHELVQHTEAYLANLRLLV